MRSLFQVFKNGKFGCINAQGDMVLECHWQRISCSCSNALVARNGYWESLWSAAGEKVAELRSRRLTSNNDSKLLVFENKPYIIHIGADNKEIWHPLTPDGEFPVNKNYQILQPLPGGRYLGSSLTSSGKLLLDSAGEKITDRIFDAWQQSCGKCNVFMNELSDRSEYFLLDENGISLSTRRLEYVYELEKDGAACKFLEPWNGFNYCAFFWQFDKSGDPFFNSLNCMASPSDDLILIDLDDFHDRHFEFPIGYLSVWSGLYSIYPSFNEATKFYCGAASASIAPGEWVIINKCGATVCGNGYSKLSSFGNSLALFYSEPRGLWGYVNPEGLEVWTGRLRAIRGYANRSHCDIWRWLEK